VCGAMSTRTRAWCDTQQFEDCTKAQCTPQAHRSLALQRASVWLKRDDTLLLDVRSRSEYDAGHFTTALNVPMSRPDAQGNFSPSDVTVFVNRLRAATQNVPKTAPIVVYCAIGLRSTLATRILQDDGFLTVVNLGGVTRSPLREAIDAGACL